MMPSSRRTNGRRARTSSPRGKDEIARTPGRRRRRSRTMRRVRTVGIDERVPGRWRTSASALHDHRAAVAEEALVDRQAGTRALDLPAVGTAAELPGELAHLGD